MFKKLITLFIISIFLFTGCFTMTHKVGNGAQGTTTSEERQWYILFGLVPINHVDSQSMAGGATDYTVETQAAPLDIVIGIVTSIVSVQPMTVKVTK